jgi:hypothetical protein
MRWTYLHKTISNLNASIMLNSELQRHDSDDITRLRCRQPTFDTNEIRAQPCTAGTKEAPQNRHGHSTTWQ